MTGWRKQLQRLEGAYSEHTLSSYQRDFGLFAQWCMHICIPNDSKCVSGALVHL